MRISDWSSDVCSSDLLSAPGGIAAAVAALAPDAIVNPAAYTAVDAAETDAETALRVNRDGPTALAEACAARGIPLIHLSTDYVFDGTDRKSTRLNYSH